MRKLKEQARRFEQEENWGRALEFYSRAMEQTGEQDESTIALLNRIGDLQVRVGDLAGAVESYEEAIERYLGIDLPNNALAVCRKLERNVPGRPTVLLMMGRIRVRQGFVVDARADFVTYAEIQIAQGDPEEAFRALEEFASLSPDDVEIRVFLADHLRRNEEDSRALEHLQHALRVALDRGESERVDELRSLLKELGGDGEAGPSEPDRSDAEADEVGGSGAVVSDEPLGFETTVLDTDSSVQDAGELPELDEHPAEEPPGSLDVAARGASTPDSPPRPAITDDADPLSALEGTVFSLDDESDPGIPEEDAPGPGFSGAPAEAEGAGGGLEFADDLHALEGGDGSEEGDLGPAELPFLDPAEGAFESDPEVDEALSGVDGDRKVPSFGDDGSGQAPAFGVRSSLDGDRSDVRIDAEAFRREGVRLFQEGRDEEAREALDRAHREFAGRGEPELAMRVVRELIFHEPVRIEYYQRLVEYAHEADDRTLLIPAYLELAEVLVRTGAERKAEVVYGQVLALDPRNPRAREGLSVGSERQSQRGRGSEGERRPGFVDLGGMVLDEGVERTFRWKVPNTDPSGDEEADFARMLAQFKEKVAQNVPSDDAEAHYDLGSAYKDMGLLDEAVAEFQQAIRAFPRHLAAYEMLGQCFLEKTQPEVALRVLGRVLQLEHPVEDELLGIYYYLGLAHQEVGNSDSAREFYERVFSLDINFRDVTERLRELR
jgi:tetratricopeptide (TPR) repeat protein